MHQSINFECLRVGHGIGSGDLYALYDALRAAHPIWRSPWGDVLVSSYEHVATALLDTRLAHVPPPGPDGVERPRAVLKDWLLYSQGDQRKILRSSMLHPFRQANFAVLQRVVDKVVKECLVANEIAGECEIVTQFARPIPERVISDLMGVPREDIGLIRGWSNSLRILLDSGFEAAFADTVAAPREMTAYFVDLIGAQLKSGDELPPLMVQFPEIVDALGLEVAARNATLFAFTGHETTVHLIGNMVLHLSRRPEIWQQLRDDPSLVGQTVQEVLRLESPVQKSCRWPSQDVEIGGVPIAEGELVVLLNGAANRDPAVYENPGQMDLSRRGPPHIAFGRGIQLCVGKALAVMEAAAVLRTLLKQYSKFETVDDRLRWEDNTSFRGLAELRLRFHP